MRRVAGPLAVVALWVVLTHAQTPTPTPSQQVFRAGTDVVSVNVSVRAGGTPVSNLHAADFVLLDNGVQQRIESVEIQAVPADVTLLVETSDAVSGYVGSLSNQVQKIAALVRPDDRLSVMTIDTYVTEVLPRQPVLKPQIGRFTPGGLSSANDALAMALLRHADPDRPHLVIAITNAIDTMSLLDVDAVREIARESSAILHVALIDIGEEIPDPPAKPYLKSSWQRLNGFRCGTSFQCSLTRLFWRARDDRPFGLFHYEDFDSLKEAAELTGGKMYLPGVFTDRTAAAIFEKVFADYRQSYILRYTPQGVKREGWHEISVTVPSAPSYTVHARRGYAVDARSPDATSDDAWSRGGDPAGQCERESRAQRAGRRVRPRRLRRRSHARSARRPIARRSFATSAPAAIPGLAILDVKRCSRSSSRKPGSWRIATMRAWRRAICSSPTRSSSGSRSRPTSSSATGSGRRSRCSRACCNPLPRRASSRTRSSGFRTSRASCWRAPSPPISARRSRRPVHRARGDRSSDRCRRSVRRRDRARRRRPPRRAFAKRGTCTGSARTRARCRCSTRPLGDRRRRACSISASCSGDTS